MAKEIRLHRRATPTWHRHYTIRPRVINGHLYCFAWVYRRFVLSPGGGFWVYGDSFDVLRDL